jgi:hypothetical protein
MVRIPEKPLTERQKAIKALTAMQCLMADPQMELAEGAYKALDMAIASLQADEAYQLEYENRDCVEVVRCKDCLHWKLLQDSSIHYCIPTHSFSGTNEFCSQGIRKEQTDGKI